MSFSSDWIRENFAAGDTARDAGLISPEDVVRFDDIVYGDDPKWQSLDVYRPAAEEGKKLPVIVSVHGGGWVYGDKDRYQFYCMDLAQRGFAVVNFSYRLAPENKFPASLEDANSVFAWVLENDEKYGFDEGSVFGVGDSAGAHLLSLYSCFCTDPEFAAAFDFRAPEGFVPKAVALNCGAYDLASAGSPAGVENMMQDLMGDLLPGAEDHEREAWKVNALAHITPGFPRAFIMTANEDFLKDQAPMMAAALMKNDVPFVFRYLGGKELRLQHVFHLDVRSVAARALNDEECAFFQKTNC